MHQIAAQRTKFQTWFCTKCPSYAYMTLENDFLRKREKRIQKKRGIEKKNPPDVKKSMSRKGRRLVCVSERESSVNGGRHTSRPGTFQAISYCNIGVIALLKGKKKKNRKAKGDFQVPILEKNPKLRGYIDKI